MASDRPLDERLSDAQQLLRDGYHDDLSRAIADARDMINAAALAAPPSAPHDYAALADRLADFRFGSVLKPDGTERDPKEWLAFEPELMRALRDLAAPPSAQDETIELVRELQSTYEGMVYHESDRAYTLALSKLLKVPLPPPPAGAPK